jgi:raffinose/stachyose/melibiose transport system substrate-binding protein
MQKRIIFILVAFSFTVFSVFAGGKTEGAPSAGKSAGTLNLMVAWEIPKDFITQFEAETGIKTNQEVVTGYETYKQARNAKIAAGESIDIITTFEDERAVFHEKGYYLDLTGDAYLERFIPAYRDAIKARFGSAFPGVCFETLMLNVWYNKTRFAELGLKPPKNYQEFLAVCDKIVAAGYTPLVQGGKDNWPFDQELHLCIGNTPVDYPEWKQMLKTGALKWNEGYLLERFKRMQDLMTHPGYYIPTPAGISYDQAFMLFAQEKALMWVMGSWATEVMTGSGVKPSFEIGAFAPPTNDATASAGALQMGTDSRMFSIFKSSKNIPNAKKFFDFMTRKDVATAFAEKTMAISTIAGVENKNLPAYKDFMENVASRKTVPFMTYPPSVSSVRENSYQALGMGTKTYKQVADEWQAAQEKDNAAGK